MKLAQILSSLMTIAAIFAQSSEATESCKDALQFAENRFSAVYGQAHAAIAIDVGAQELHNQYFGYKIDENSQFLLGSVTKTLFALKAMQMREQNLLNWDLKISDFKLASSVPSAFHSVSVKRLMNHSSGIEDYMNRETQADQDFSNVFLTTPHSFSEILGTVQKNLLFVPGEKLRYSNSNYLILGQILGELKSESTAQLMNEFTMEQNLRDTYELDEPRAGVLGGTSLALTNMNAVGNMVSTQKDLRALLKQIDEEKVVSKVSLETMYQKQDDCLGDRCERYGIGFSIRPQLINGDLMVLHQGHLRDVSAMIAKVPEKKVNLVILSDIGGIDSESVGTEVLERLAKANCF